LPDHVYFQSDDRLEGILELPEERPVIGGLVVAHPHPLHGGTMAQPLVFRIARTARDRGMAVLRFNFREVGRSQGSYTGVDEHRDVQAAVAYLRQRLDAMSPASPLPLGLAGYSFGSVQSARATGRMGDMVQALALVALVVHWEGYRVGGLEGLQDYAGPVLAVCGQLDELVDPAAVEETLKDYGVDYRMCIVKGARHTFDHQKPEVARLIASFMEESFKGLRLREIPGLCDSVQGDQTAQPS